MKNYTCYKNLKKTEKSQLFDTFKKFYLSEKITFTTLKNLWNEHFSSEEKMKKFIDWCLYINSINNDISLEKMKNYIYENHLLAGDHIQIKTPQYFGTVLPVETFEKTIKNIYNKEFGKNIISFDEIIRDLKKGEIKSIYKDIVIKNPKRSIWLTWNGSSINKPFSFLKNKKCSELLTALGLGYESYQNKPYYALTIKNSSDIPFRPTWFDSDFNSFFKPTDNVLKHGIIKPLNGGVYFINGKKFELDTAAFKLPEAINKSIFYKLENIHELELINV